MDRVDAVVVGAGVVGLAAARQLALAGHEVVVLEREGLIGSHTSSRNSEVIHAGIYYPQGSAKAALCVRGKEMLYEYCRSRHVPHSRLGKIIVATDESQIEQLEGVREKAAANGVEDLEFLDKARLGEMEPALRGVAGYLSPSTGIVDSHGLMLSLQGEIEDHGGMIAFHTGFRRAVPLADGFEVVTESDGEEMRLATGILINAAGLYAGEVSDAIEGLAPEHRRTVHYCKGNYFSVGGRVPFSHLIYPVPERDGLGVHLTLDLQGQGRFGPDTEWVESIDYGLTPARADSFYDAVRRYWPELKDGSLTPTYTGVRPKLFPQGGAFTDFTIEGPEIHGLPGLVNLFGIESPGLTSSLAIADALGSRLGLRQAA